MSGGPARARCLTSARYDGRLAMKAGLGGLSSLRLNKRQMLARSAMVSSRVRNGAELMAEIPVCVSIAASVDWRDVMGSWSEGAVSLSELYRRRMLPTQMVARLWICLNVAGGTSKTRYRSQWPLSHGQWVV